MASDENHSTWSAQQFGYDRTDVSEYQELATDLRSRMSGSVEFDEYARILYSTDGSIYQAQPAGAVYPVDVQDVQAAVEVASAHDVPVLPRGVGRH